MEIKTLELSTNFVDVQSESRTTRMKMIKPKGFWIHFYDQPSFYVSSVPKQKNEGTIKRIKAKAKQIKDLKRNPRMVIVPWKIKVLPPVIIQADEFSPSKELIPRYANKMVESKFYQVIKMNNSLIKRAVKRIKMKTTQKRKR